MSPKHTLDGWLVPLLPPLARPSASSHSHPQEATLLSTMEARPSRSSPDATGDGRDPVPFSAASSTGQASGIQEDVVAGGKASRDAGESSQRLASDYRGLTGGGVRGPGVDAGPGRHEQLQQHEGNALLQQATCDCGGAERSDTPSEGSPRQGRFASPLSHLAQSRCSHMHALTFSGDAAESDFTHQKDFTHQEAPLDGILSVGAVSTPPGGQRRSEGGAPGSAENASHTGAPERVCSPRRSALSGCTIRFVGWEGAEEEEQKLREIIAWAGGVSVSSGNTRPCTHVLLGPFARGEASEARAQTGGSAAHIVDAEWLRLTCGQRASPVPSPGAEGGAACSESTMREDCLGASAPPPESSSSHQMVDFDDPMGVSCEMDMASAEQWLPADADFPEDGPASMLGDFAALPANYRDAWDRNHVCLPCSPKARCTDGRPLWPVVCSALSPPPTGVSGLLAALRTIRAAVGGRWGLGRIKDLLFNVMNADLRREFIDIALPELCALVTETPSLFEIPLPLLRQGSPGHVRLNADQCACLLANAFFCTMPFRNDRPRDRAWGGYRQGTASTLPYFSFCWLLGDLPASRVDGGSISAQHVAKWFCLLAYFQRIAERRRDARAAEWGRRIISFSRLVADTSELELEGSWSTCGAPICEVSTSSRGTIEDAGPHTLQVDFANSTLGGGVLRNGCVQEEIRFLLCPELIVSRLLAEPLADNEAFVMRGFERFSLYTGYASSFAFAGPYEEGPSEGARKREPEDQLHTSLVAIDATPYGRSMSARLDQYRHADIERELNKAYVGYGPLETAAHRGESATLSLSAPGGRFGLATLPAGAADGSASPLPVCTGNWGCGAFGGCLQLKALVQILAASRGRRPFVSYLTFGDEQLASQLAALSSRMHAVQMRVSQLVLLLRRFDARCHPAQMPGACADLFGYLEVALGDAYASSVLPPAHVQGTHVLRRKGQSDGPEAEGTWNSCD